MKLSEYDDVISAYKMYISNFFISVTSGQVIFATSPLQVNGQKINSVIFTLAQAYLSGIISYRAVGDNSSKNLHCLPLERSFEVTRGHQPSFANKFYPKEIEIQSPARRARSRLRRRELHSLPPHRSVPRPVRVSCETECVRVSRGP